MSRLLEEYKSTISVNLKSKLNCKNIYEVPKIKKIVLNMGIGDGKDDAKLIDKAQEELSDTAAGAACFVQVDVSEVQWKANS